MFSKTKTKYYKRNKHQRLKCFQNTHVRETASLSKWYKITQTSSRFNFKLKKPNENAKKKI